MAGLQRSAQTFRRSGSSGLVWDERFLSGDLNQMKEEEEGLEFRELRHSQSVGSIQTTKRGRSNGMQAFRAVHVSPSMDPPSPEVHRCIILCGIFGRNRGTKPAKPRRH
ncbi:MAPK kinase substrate protein At1g80180-like [Phoenix dactylifera]|uniref:MAPK kinase substrate protein At1g80180-like n=1 Tax=Phoenix dactylifera TaxID=42345 RepID=A0A8B9ADZ8_PHODC|nr:MAPK kinase substrate protein At1g80180-like [Phoenix dactylifera]